ncbi:hypothetical protein NQZ68_016281 [Dissostichus eleginoides]|nr:hypothetical protein NQZ68_016281 [Dissostichus eleginoides]
MDITVAGSGKRERVVGSSLQQHPVMAVVWRNVPPENHREEEGTDSEQCLRNLHSPTPHHNSWRLSEGPGVTLPPQPFNSVGPSGKGGSRSMGEGESCVERRRSQISQWLHGVMYL